MKEKLEEKASFNSGITVSLQRLMFEGKSMENDRTMTDYGITAGRTLHMQYNIKDT